MPNLPEDSDRTYRDRLYQEQMEYEELHDGAEKWTFDTLRALIAQRVCASGAAQGHAAVATVEDDAWEYDEQVDPPPSPPSSPVIGSPPRSPLMAAGVPEPGGLPKSGGREPESGGREPKSGGLMRLPGPTAPTVARMPRA